MFKISATTIIYAPIATVWQTMTDVAAYAEWNSQLSYLGGTLAQGQKIHLKLEPQGQSGYEFQPEVIVLESEKEFAWVARTGFRGIFDGEHHFVLEDLGNGQTRLHNYEIYSGLLSPIMKRLPMMKGADEGFALMNREIKERAETLSGE